MGFIRKKIRAFLAGQALRKKYNSYSPEPGIGLKRKKPTFWEAAKRKLVSLLLDDKSRGA